MEKILIIIAAVVLLMLVLYIVIHFSPGRRKGRAAERQMAKLIKKMGKRDNIKIINNAYLPLYGKACEVDHLVFGRFGILVVETKGISGVVSGSGKKLDHTIGTKKYKLYNPQMQNRTHIDNVIHHLKKGGFNGIPVIGAVVFTADDIELRSDVGMSPEQFRQFYHNLKDAGCNQDVLYGYFHGLLVRNPMKRMWIRTRKKND